jgi:hypothetical protein
MEQENIQVHKLTGLCGLLRRRQGLQVAALRKDIPSSANSPQILPPFSAEKVQVDEVGAALDLWNS